MARPGVATGRSPRNVASPQVVATQRLAEGVSGQQAAPHAAMLAGTGHAMDTAVGSSQVSLLHVLVTCWRECSSHVVQQCTADSPWPLGEQPVLGPCQAQLACLFSLWASGGGSLMTSHTPTLQDEHHFLNSLPCPAELSVPGLACSGGCSKSQQAEGNQPQYCGGRCAVPCNPTYQRTQGDHSALLALSCSAGWLADSSLVSWVLVLFYRASVERQVCRSCVTLLICAGAASPCPWKQHTAQQLVVVASPHKAVHFFVFTSLMSTCHSDMEGRSAQQQAEVTSQPFLVMHGFRHSTCTSGLPAQSPHLLRLGCRPCRLTLWCVCPAGQSSRVLHQVPEGPAAHQAGSGHRGDRGGPHTPYPHHRGWQGVTSSLSQQSCIRASRGVLHVEPHSVGRGQVLARTAAALHQQVRTRFSGILSRQLLPACH